MSDGWCKEVRTRMRKRRKKFSSIKISFMLKLGREQLMSWSKSKQLNDFFSKMIVCVNRKLNREISSTNFFTIIFLTTRTESREKWKISSRSWPSQENHIELSRASRARVSSFRIILESRESDSRMSLNERKTLPRFLIHKSHKLIADCLLCCWKMFI